MMNHNIPIAWRKVLAVRNAIIASLYIRTYGMIYHDELPNLDIIVGRMAY